MKTNQQQSYIEKQVAAGNFKTKTDLMNHLLLNVLQFESTEEQKNDRVDFKEIAIWTIKNALDAAYLAGQMSVKK